MVSRSVPNKIDPCPTDGPVGAALMVLACLGAVSTFLLLSLIATLFGGFAPSETPTMSFASAPGGVNPFLSAQEPGHPWFISILALVLPLGYCGAVFACGLGIWRGSQWAFSLGIVLFAIATLAGSGTAVLGIGVVVYCVLRLLGVIGGKDLVVASTLGTSPE